MKKLLFLLILATILTTTKAQIWAPIGAKWHYSDIDYMGSAPRIIESIKDTVVNGISCRVLNGGCLCGISQRHIMYSEYKKVYWYNDSSNSFHTLYNFNANAGDSWTIVPEYPSDSFKVFIDSVKWIVINSDTLKVQYTSSNESSNHWFSLGGEVIENIGNITSCLFPQLGLADPWTGGFRCYQDSQIGLYKSSNLPCDTTIIWVTINQLTNKNDHIIISPNPASEKISVNYLSNTNQKIEVNIFDICNRLLTKKEIVENQKEEIDISYFINGIYFIKFLSGNGEITFRKIIKN